MVLGVCTSYTYRLDRENRPRAVSLIFLLNDIGTFYTSEYTIPVGLEKHCRKEFPPETTKCLAVIPTNVTIGNDTIHHFARSIAKVDSPNSVEAHPDVAPYFSSL